MYFHLSNAILKLVIMPGPGTVTKPGDYWRLIRLLLERKRKGFSSMEAKTVESQVLSKVYEEVRQRFEGFDDPAHDWEHIERVYKLALYIAERESADTFIVGMAALMHDIGRLSNEKTKHHADSSVIMASELLSACGVTAGTQQAILHAITAHSFSLGIEPRTLEAKVVRDADRLDSLGAIGILRWAITGTVRRTTGTQTYYPEDPFGERHILEDRRYMLDHFFTKLLKLGSTMSTQTGRAMAEQRTAFMHAYLDELRRELEW
jgi:uncharacterized protein